MNRILYILSGMLIFISCVKNTIPYVPPIDENFDWKTTETVSISIPVSSGVSSNTKAEQYASTVKIYSSPLYSEGSLIASGAAYEGKVFETVMDLAKGVDQVFVKIITPRGLVTFTTYDIVGSKAVKVRSGKTSMKSAGERIGNEPVIPEPYFPSSYDVTVTSSSQLSGTLSGNKTYFIPQGKSIRVNNKLLFDNANQNAVPVLYVGGNLVLENTADHYISFCSLVVLDGGSVTFNGRVDLGWTEQGLLAVYVGNYGRLQLKRGFASTSNRVGIVNRGEMSVKGVQASILGNGALFYNTGSLEIDANRLSLSNSGTVFYNMGDMEAKNISLSSGAGFFNYSGGAIECDNVLEADNNCFFKNAGELESDIIEFRSNASFYNYGYPGGSNGSVVTGILDFTNNSNYLYQHGFFTVKTTFLAKGKIDNYGNMECQVITDGSTAGFYSYSGSLLKTAYLSHITNSVFYMESGSIIFIYKNGKGAGNTGNWDVKFVNMNDNGRDYALVLWGVSDKKPDNTIINSQGEISFSGNIENYCPKKNDSQNRKYTADLCMYNAYWGGREHHIPETEYNEGLGDIGGNDPVDADGDGVPAGEDVDDNDPSVTHVSYFPAANTWGTYFFEDLWPYIGDYDMNDIVLGFRIAYYSKGELTAGNNVVYMDINWKLRAVGSQMHLSCGIQLDDITPNMVASVENNNGGLAGSPISGNMNGLESGQSRAVFALFNDPAELYGVSKGINVFHDVDASTAIPVEKRVRVRFTGGVTKDRLLIGKINPFIVVSADQGQDRGREVHMSNNPPTDKVNRRYFLEGFVSGYNPYRATNGMVWGYMVPEVFRYPIEMIPITSAYPNFVKWYQSSGLQYRDWYDTSIPGNAVEEYLYDSQWQ